MAMVVIRSKGIFIVTYMYLFINRWIFITIYVLVELFLIIVFVMVINMS
jgi:hypothetical protein